MEGRSLELIVHFHKLKLNVLLQIQDWEEKQTITFILEELQVVVSRWVKMILSAY